MNRFKSWNISFLKSYLLTVPLFLILFTFLAYGLLVNKLGFYWDDWPWIWLYHVEGYSRLLGIDRFFRPLTGEILCLGALLAGESPLGWQVLNLFYRWLSAFSLFWMLSKLWPERKDVFTWVACIFLVYPGFSQQFVSINSSRHILPLAITFLSIGFMILGVRATLDNPDNDNNLGKRKYISNTLIALIFMIVAMLVTDYYYGLELIRPFILWFVYSGVVDHPRAIKRVTLYWLPYLVVMLTLFVRRFIISAYGNYEIVLTDMLLEQPVVTIGDGIRFMAQAMYSTIILPWREVLIKEIFYNPSIRGTYLVVILFSFILSMLFFLTTKSTSSNFKFFKQIISLGVISAVLAPIPFLLTGIKVGLTFPADRTTLPMMLAASMLIIGIIDLVIRWRIVKIITISSLMALAIGMHFFNANSYANDWQLQRTFFHQLLTRAPTLVDGTALFYQYTDALKEFHNTDNSLQAPLNWIYAPAITEKEIPFEIFDLRAKDFFSPQYFESKDQIKWRFGEYKFQGSTQNILAIDFSPPSCLVVLDAKFKGLYSNLPIRLARIVRYSNQNVIDTSRISTPWLQKVFGEPPEPDWCLYYQKAELARQLEDWQAIVVIDDSALQLRGNHWQATEMLPFIIGNVKVENWEKAKQLTLETYIADQSSAELLCKAWSEIYTDMPSRPDQIAEVMEIIDQLKCSR